MSDPHSQIGLGLNIGGPSHFTDLTNLVASSRNAIDGVSQGAESNLSAHGDFAPSSHHMTVVHGATYRTSPQDVLMKHASADLNAFTNAHIGNNETTPSTQPHCQQQYLQCSPNLQHAETKLSTSQSGTLSQAFGVDMDSQPTHAQTATQGHTATHHYFDSPTRCHDLQASDNAHLGLEDGQISDQVSPDQALATSVELKMEHSPEFERNAVKSYPPSPPTRSQMLQQTNLRALEHGMRPITGRHVPSHRPSHSLGQAAAFIGTVPSRDLHSHSHASAPVSPCHGISADTFPVLFHNPAPRQDMGLGMAEHSPAFAQSGAQMAAMNSGPFAASSGPSVRSTSPSVSLASTSMTSISPLGSARINPDGSFTSQESSFDSISNTASGSFSRASSTSEDVFSFDVGALSVASSLRMTKQKKKLRNIDRKMICDYSNANPAIKQDAIANEFGIERSTVSKILKQKEKWLAIEPGSEAAKIAKHRAIKFPAVEDRLSGWVAQLKARGEAIRDSTIRNEALRIARELGLGEDKFKASGGWIEKFRERNQIPKPQPAEGSSSLSDAGATKREPAAVSNGGGVPLAPRPGTPSQSGSSNQSQPARRQPARSSKAKGTPQKRARDEQEATQAILGMSPLSQDMERMHFQSGGPPGCMPDSAFFRQTLYFGHPSMPQLPMQNCPDMHHGHGGVSDPSQPTKEEAESDLKRRRAMDDVQDNRAGLGLGPPIEFQFPLAAGPSTSSSQVHMSAQLSQALGQAMVTPPKPTTRNRRTPAKPADRSGRGRSRRGKARLSNANHTPQTPSPLSMSPADARGGEPTFHGFHGFDAADAEQLTAVALERIRAMQNSGDGSSIVTAEQAQQSLEIILKFLSEQPSDFLPPNHFMIFGNLQANIEQKIRDQATGDHAPESSGSQMALSLQSSETNGEAVSASAEEH
ncbi:hypothetical protein EX895_000633 [Sporisorium graminicola]|uniref:HTH CENPB-type domain-containing protein n=1 Tax=Sporisorium graminicola TaxID=280036 RepID=A0A4U7L0G5_9BASI|nr:hypothetical protein EX895_000633 [Sporisorium graminicola]TKY90635.1 hypothetical protein EX895_000633 [Sporisorium graminicola]